MATVGNLIKDSLRLIGAIASGETPAASDSADALSVLNQILDSWSAEGLLISGSSRETFSLIAGQSSYTFGDTGDFNSARPVSIVHITSGPEETPLIKVEDPAEWAALGNKTTESSAPTHFFIDGTFPLETVKFWPVPSEVSDVNIYSQKPIAGFAALSDVLELAPGYEKALKYNLAIEIALEFGKEINPRIDRIANQTKAILKRNNIKTIYMKSDVTGSGRRSNIYTGK